MAAEEEIWEGEDSIGIMRISFHPHTQVCLRQTFNTFQARMFGMHREEATARILARDLPFYFNEIDGLRYLLAEIGPHLHPAVLVELFLCHQSFLTVT